MLLRLPGIFGGFVCRREASEGKISHEALSSLKVRFFHEAMRRQKLLTHILNGSEQRTGRETRNLRDWKDQRESRSIDSEPVSDEMVTSLKRRLPACQSEKRRLGLLQHQVLPRDPDDCRSNMSSRVLCMGGCPAETGSKTDPGKGRSRRKKV